jgi:DNA-directed RNA polymerase specialized sigma24 family protein
MEETPDRVERLLALLLVREVKTQREKIVQLNVAGFTNTEVADLLQTTSAVVNSELYAARKGKKRNPKKKS